MTTPLSAVLTLLDDEKAWVAPISSRLRHWTSPRFSLDGLLIEAFIRNQPSNTYPVARWNEDGSISMLDGGTSRISMPTEIATYYNLSPDDLRALAIFNDQVLSPLAASEHAKIRRAEARNQTPPPQTWRKRARSFISTLLKEPTHA